MWMIDVIVCNLIDTNKETVPLLPSVDNAENSSKSEPFDVDKEQNDEVKVTIIHSIGCIWFC